MHNIFNYSNKTWKKKVKQAQGVVQSINHAKANHTHAARDQIKLDLGGQYYRLKKVAFENRKFITEEEWEHSGANQVFSQTPPAKEASCATTESNGSDADIDYNGPTQSPSQCQPQSQSPSQEESKKDVAVKTTKKRKKGDLKSDIGSKRGHKVIEPGASTFSSSPGSSASPSKKAGNSNSNSGSRAQSWNPPDRKKMKW